MNIQEWSEGDDRAMGARIATARLARGFTLARVAGAGIHVVDVPQPDTVESVRCLVATTQEGHVAATCPPKSLDLAMPDSN